jgi:hypothetical protein
VTQEGDQQQLDWERRAGRPAAAVAFVAALLPMASALLRSALSGSRGAAGGLQAFLERSPVPLLTGVLGALGVLLLIPVLGYLFRATRARREEAPAFARNLLVAGAAGLAVALVVQQIFVMEVARDFLAGEDQSDRAATAAITNSPLRTVGIVTLLLNVVVGGAIAVISLNAMRAGLLSRFMGFIGIGLAAFYAIPFLGGPEVIQLFWMVALGLLLLDRWPGGRGPAWERVEAIPWPTQADRVETARRERVEEAQPDSEATGRPDESGGADGGDPEHPRPPSRKRRRGQ